MTRHDSNFSRRAFMGLAIGTPLVIKLGCGPNPVGGAGGAGGDSGASAIPEGAVLLGLYAGDGAEALGLAAKRLDFSWLKPGDSVLIKVACNSHHTHPSTTSPSGVAGLVAELKARGAGRVIVADQSGVEWVRNSARGR